MFYGMKKFQTTKVITKNFYFIPTTLNIYEESFFNSNPAHTMPEIFRNKIINSKHYTR